MAKKPTSGSGKKTSSLGKFIADQEPQLVQQYLVPEYMAIRHGVVQRVYFYRNLTSATEAKVRPTVLPRPLTLAYFARDNEEIQRSLDDLSVSHACAVRCIDMEGAASVNKPSYAFLLSWITAKEMSHKIHFVNMEGVMQSGSIGDTSLLERLTKAVPDPEALAFSEREYSLVFKDLDARIVDALSQAPTLSNIEAPFEEVQNLVTAVREIVTEWSARRADDVLVNMLAIQEGQANKLAKKVKADLEALRAEMMGKDSQAEKRARRLQNELDMTKKRAETLSRQVAEARQESAILKKLKTTTASPALVPSEKLSKEVSGYAAMTLFGRKLSEFPSFREVIGI